MVVECGTAIGYSGLWIARELKAAGRGKLITIEIDEDRSGQVVEKNRPERWQTPFASWGTLLHAGQPVFRRDEQKGDRSR